MTCEISPLYAIKIAFVSFLQLRNNFPALSTYPADCTISIHVVVSLGEF